MKSITITNGQRDCSGILSSVTSEIDPFAEQSEKICDLSPENPASVRRGNIEGVKKVKSEHGGYNN